MNEKKAYERPFLDVERFNALNIVTTSLEPEKWELPAKPNSTPEP